MTKNSFAAEVTFNMKNSHTSDPPKTHWSWLVYQQHYKMQGQQHDVTEWRINSKTDSRTNDILVSTRVSIFLQKVGLTIHWSRLVYRQSYKKQDFRYAGLDQYIDSPTKSRTYDTLVSTSVSIILQKVGLTIHWSQLVYPYSYKNQDLRYTRLIWCIDSPSKSKTYDTLISTSVSIVLQKAGLTIH